MGFENCGIKTKELWKNPEYRKMMSEAHKGQEAWNKGIPLNKVLSKEKNKQRKNKISMTMKKQYKNNERIQWSKGLTKEIDERLRIMGENISRTIMGHTTTKETKRKIKESNEKYWANMCNVKRNIFKQKLKKRMQRITHHINGNHNDNRPKNLMIISQSEHSKLHRTQENMLKC